MNNLLDILNKSVNYLEKKEVKNPRIVVEKILSEVLNVERIMLYANFERILLDNELDIIRKRLNEFVNKKENDVVEINTQEDKNTVIQTNDNTVKFLLDRSVEYLNKNNILESQLIAEILFSHILKVDRMMLFTKYKDIVLEDKKEKIKKYIKKIGKDKFPLQYILNEQEFYGRNFYVNKGVLIPRQDTEILVEKAINIIKKEKMENVKVLDLGVGSGIIGITIALEIENSKVMGVDISDTAIEIANKNKELLNAKNIKIVKSNLFEKIEYKEFDMIVSNPPYIAYDETSVMSENTLLYEPEEALFAENEGLYFYYEISEKGYEYIKENGFLLFEIGYKQGEKVKNIMEKIGYKNVEIIKDLQGLDRVVLGQK